ncbi:MAG: hypothetical protein KDA21_04380, partial [Phycisphaerales bacterium]|nr:hypothetical protein [Phycisphaerales bacterium]
KKPWFSPETWTPLAAELEDLREPVVQVEAPKDPPPEKPVVVVKKDPRLPPLDWKYKGFIVSSNGRRALVELGDGTELFLGLNAVLPDEANAAGSIRITEIEPDHIIVDRGMPDPETIERFDPRPSSERLSDAAGPESRGPRDPRGRL